jgi:arylsulfatase
MKKILSINNSSNNFKFSRFQSFFTPTIMATGLLGLFACQNGSEKEADQEKPNIVLIMADDMGYSDLGCTGSEIETPNLDRLAEEGLLMTRFYNEARSAPTRASLLTGLYQHQTGMGNMTEGLMYPDSTRIPSYQGYLSNNCVTIAEALKQNNYQTFISGKWHVGDPEKAHPENRGFDRTFSLIWGSSNYFNLEPFISESMEITMKLDGKEYTPPEDFYMTRAFTDHAIQFVEERNEEQPFFLYLSYTAPHWPLHALPGDIKRFEGDYMQGWNTVRQKRYARMKELGIIPDEWELSPSFNEQSAVTPEWDTLNREEKHTWDRRMAVYAAMMYRMDAGIGRVVEKLKSIGEYENTLILFLSDNGACRASLYRATSWCAERGGPIGSENSFDSYGPRWANVSNTPFRLFKSSTMEGGIITPLIAHWPKVIKQQHISHKPGHIIDIMPTLLDITNTQYPKKYKGRQILPLEGQSLLPIIQGREEQFKTDRSLYWEHQGNRAVREGKWKLVYLDKTGEWKLYDMQRDGTELNDLAGQHPGKVESMKESYFNWADRVGVVHNTDSLILVRNADWFETN